MSSLTDGICYNGGTWHNRSRCECPKLFKGPTCQEIMCVNGGLPIANYTCMCPDQIHYRGRHCELLLCSNSGTAVGGKCQCPSTHTGAYCDTRSHLWAAILGAVALAVICAVGCWMYCNWLANREDQEEEDFLPWEDLSYSQRIQRRLSTMRRSIAPHTGSDHYAGAPSPIPSPPQRTVLTSPPSYEELEEAETSHPPPTYDDAISMRSQKSSVVSMPGGGNRNSVGSLISRSSGAAYLSSRDLREYVISEADSEEADRENETETEDGTLHRLQRSGSRDSDEMISVRSDGALSPSSPISAVPRYLEDHADDRSVKSEGSHPDPSPVQLIRSHEISHLNQGSEASIGNAEVTLENVTDSPTGSSRPSSSHRAQNVFKSSIADEHSRTPHLDHDNDEVFMEHLLWKGEPVKYQPDNFESEVKQTFPNSHLMQDQLRLESESSDFMTPTEARSEGSGSPAEEHRDIDVEALVLAPRTNDYKPFRETAI